MSATGETSTQAKAIDMRGHRYALVFTTYGWDAFIAQQFARNAARATSGDMHVICDESHGTVAVPAGITKTVASETIAAGLGLRIAYHRALFWHNIDYLYYIFFDRFASYDYYIFLDYDAVVNTDVDALVAEIARRGIDFVGAPVDCRIEDWAYLRQHAGTYDLPDLDARISAVTVLSNRALAHLFARRRQMSAAPTPAQQAFWPFCEAFVPSELKIAGFALADLAEFGDVQKFAWWPPTLDEALPSAPGFVHPVLDRTRFIASMLKNSRTREFFVPGTRLWRAMRASWDRRWLRPFLAECGRRLYRKLTPRPGAANPVASVGMHWE